MANNPTIHDALRDAGLEPAKSLDLVGGGKLQRFRVAGDKPGSLNGWIVFRDDGACASASFGSWKTGITAHWTAKPWDQLRKIDREAVKQARQAAQAQLEAETAAKQAEARSKATRLWDRARPATDAHPYLQKKRVRGYGTRVLREALLIPLRDVEGTLQNLQFIYPDGKKRFLTGGRVKGCYCPIGRPSASMLLAEGFATGATLHQATGEAVAVCFSAGNLQAVASLLRRKFPSLQFVLCADNDTATPGNPGLRAAVEAARAVGGVVAVPRLWEVRA